MRRKLIYCLSTTGRCSTIEGGWLLHTDLDDGPLSFVKFECRSMNGSRVDESEGGLCGDHRDGVAYCWLHTPIGSRSVLKLLLAIERVPSSSPPAFLRGF